jgi:hypothetical protein
MKPSVALRVAAITSLVVGCGGTPIATPTPLPTLAGSPTTAPPPTSGPTASSGISYQGSLAVLPAEPRPGFQRDIRCSGAIGADDPVVLVTVPATSLDGEEQVELRNRSDPANPRTACTLGGANGMYDAWLLDARHLVIRDGDAEPQALFAVVDLPEVLFHWFALPAGSGWESDLLAIAPGLDMVLWNEVHAGDRDVDVIHLATADDDEALVTLPDPNQGRCGQPTDSSFGRWSPTGPEAFVLVQPIDGWQSLLVLDPLTTFLSIVPPDGGWAAGEAPQMAVWSPTQEELYWSQGGDVWRWTPDVGRKRIFEGVTWFDPTFSADGRYLAWLEMGDAGVGDIHVYDTRSAGRPKKVASSATSPRFIDATHLWFLTGEAMGDCSSLAPTPRLYDVVSGTARDSDIPAVLSAWPATSAQD